jgi:imidazolonepropionase-like amidohydrolase
MKVNSLASLVGLLLLVSRALAGDLLLLNGSVVDPVARTIRKKNLLIQNGTIASIIAPADFTGQTIDLTGKFVVPGLNDMHVHSWGNTGPNQTLQILGADSAAKAMLYSGVTSFLDLFAVEDEIFLIRNIQRAGGTIGADIFASGPLFTCSGGHGTEYAIPTRVIDTPEDARRQIIKLSAKHPDVIKIVYDHARSWFPSMNQLTMSAAIQTAEHLGLKTIVHIGTWQDAREAILAGATAITHIYEKDIPSDLPALMKAKNVWSIPTMTVQLDFLTLIEHPVLLDSKLLGDVTTPQLLQSYRGTFPNDQTAQAFLFYQRKWHRSFKNSLKKLADAGVKIMTGTDAGNLGTFQGYSVHREMALMVAAGMSNWDVLSAATVLPGEFLNQKYGVAEGNIANLIVLSASPIEDIRNSEKIELVIHHGKIIDRCALLLRKLSHY